MLKVYRYHNPAKCDSNDTERCFKGPADNPRNQKQLKQPCPIWVRGNTPDGTYVRQSLKKVLKNSTRDWTEALRLVREWEQSGSQPKPAVEATRTTVEQLRDMYLENMRAENLNTETIRKAKFLFSQLMAFSEQQGLQFVDEFSRTQIEAFRNSWTDGALSRQKRYERLRNVVRYALAHDMIGSNPTESLKGIKVKSGDKVKDFSDDEMRAILDAAKADADKRIYPLVLLLRYSGLRISDATMLHKDRLKDNQLTVRTIKTDVEVSVALPTAVANRLLSIEREHDGYYFWNGRSTLASLTDLYRDHHLRRVFKAAKVQGTPHMFRHTFVHSLLNAGMSMREVAAAIGDTVHITERHYGKWNKREQERLNQRIVAVNESDEFLAALSRPPASVMPIALANKARKSA
ncbi:MAG TPA: tyrosine-type recombinase/integrase [Candidatus Acidoferrales bacterium]|jgi:integrase|nr:tyrosine-type recombinase/integrase [Candidatus Acidoferrales bacterium]